MLKWILLLLLVISSQLANGEGCGPRFNGKCTCGIAEYSYTGTKQYIVNCTDQGFTNATVLEYMPQQTQVLIFTGNDIPELPWNVFGVLNNFTSLTTIDMSNNKINEIRGKTYHHVPNVRLLILNHNNLSISRNDDDVNHHHPRVFSNFINLESLHLTDAFMDNTSAELSEDLHDIFVNSNLTKLQKLHLEQNEISSFRDRRVFCDLPSLSDLHLGDNDLTEINFNITCLRNLRFLDLKRNKFEYVNAKDLALLDELQKNPIHTRELIVDYDLNPFVCDCKLSPFKEWIQKTKVTVRNGDRLICRKDKTIPKRIIDENLGKCIDAPAANAKSGDAQTIVLVFLLVVLCFVLFGLVAALTYLSREKVKYLVSPVFDTVSKKVQYTTIKDEECPEVHV